MDKQNRFKETKSSEGAFEERDFYRESLSKLRLVRELQRKEELLNIILGLNNLYLLTKEFISSIELDLESIYNDDTDTLDCVSQKIEIIQKNINNIDSWFMDG